MDGAIRSRRQLVSNLRFNLDRLLDRRSRHHALVVALDVEEVARREIERIAEAPEQAEQVDVGDRIAAAHRPFVVSQPLVGELVDRARMVEPLPACRMDGRGDERHPRHRLRLGLDILRQQAGLREPLGEIEQDAGHFGEQSAVDQQGRHLALRIDGPERGSLMLLLGKRHRLGLEARADLVQRDMSRHRARARRIIQSQHGRSSLRSAYNSIGRMTGPLTLLLSAHALKTWGARIAAAVPDGSLAFLSAEQALAGDGPSAADIAFMTREVTGRSSKNNPTPELKGFETVLRKSPGLKWLQIHPAGAERPIYRELRDRGVKVTTASGATAITVAHSTLGALIALNRRFPLLADAQRRHAWEPRLGERSPRDLKGQCAVIVGMGPIGRNIARLLKALGMRSIGVRRNAEPVPECDRTIAYADLPSVLPQADVLILCCPASPVTRGIANAAVFAAMPKGGLFINVSRGEIAVEKDVIAALQNGHLSGAYLDVFEREPLDPASPLWDLPNVLISPHTASHSLGQNEAIFDIFLDNLARFRAGRDLRNDVDNLS